MTSGEIRIARADGPAPGRMKTLHAGGRQVAVANVDGCYHAFDAVCPHTGGPLAEGRLRGNVVICPWHRGVFDVRTGKIRATPPLKNVTCYRVRVADPVSGR